MDVGRPARGAATVARRRTDGTRTLLDASQTEQGTEDAVNEGYRARVQF
jgi:hypothetical protein